MMKWSTNCSLPRQRENKTAAKRKGRGQLRQSKYFFPLAQHVAVNHVVPPGIWPVLIQNRRGFSCHRHNFGFNSEEYIITHYKRLPGPVKV